MARQSAKNAGITTISVGFDGGVNLFDSPTSMADNQMQLCSNFWYAGAEAVLSSRSGLAFAALPVLASGTPVAIAKLHSFVQDAGHAYLVAAMEDGNLYYLQDNSGTRGWVPIGALANAAIVPSMLDFGGNLLIADGGACVRSWSGPVATLSPMGEAISVSDIAAGVCLTTDTGSLAPGCSFKFAADSYGPVAGNTYAVTAVVPGVSFTLADASINPGAVSATTGVKMVPSYHLIEGSPSGATALAAIGNRVACNCATDPDAVYFSAVEDETQWQMVNGALMIRAGYRDAMQVIGFAVFTSDLLVFKSGQAGNASGRMIYRISTAGSSPGGWSCTQLSKNNTATSPHAIEFYGNNVFFGSDLGIMDIGGVLQYGDLQLGVVGRPVNPGLNGRDVLEIRYLPALGMMFALVDGDSSVLVYSPVADAWTMLDFAGLFMRSVCQADTAVYLAGENGNLYLLTANESQDETAPGVKQDYTCAVRGKVFSVPHKALIRSTRIYYETLADGDGELDVIGRDTATTVALLSWSANTGPGQLYSAGSEQLASAGELLASNTADYAVSRARFRDQAFCFQVKTSSGRIRLRQLQCELALVSG
jgi:hypothetical protein